MFRQSKLDGGGDIVGWGEEIQQELIVDNFLSDKIWIFVIKML
jgi:hypothetical protein